MSTEARGAPEASLVRGAFAQYNLRVPVELAARIDAVVHRLNATRSDEERLSRNAIILAAIRDGIEEVDEIAAARERETAGAH